jgi:phage recombination protein Bet
MSTQALALWNSADVDLVKSIVAEKATPDEFRLLVHLANKYQLDPLAKQIYCIKYGNKPASMFAGLAGFITIAERTGKYGGVVPEIWREDEPWSVEYVAWEGGQRRTGTFSRDYQWVAKATVYRTDAPHPFIAQVWESEYSSGRDLWAAKPRTMITKVAMCQALRLAFSISGLYDRDEINEDAHAVSGTITSEAAQLKRLADPTTGEIIEGTAREVQAEPTTQPTPDPAIKAAVEAFKREAGIAGLTEPEQTAYAKQQYPNRKLATLTAAEWKALADKCHAMYAGDAAA